MKNNLRQNLLPIVTFAKVDIKRLFRDKVAIFFVFFFPLIFLVVFGSIFKNDSDMTFRVAIINESSQPVAKDFANQLANIKSFKVDNSGLSVDQAKTKMNRGQIDATILLPPEFGVTENNLPKGKAIVLYDQNNEQAGQTLGTILQGIFKDANEKVVSSPQPFTVIARSTATKGLTQFDYIFSGILGFTLLSLGIFGPTNAFPRLKQRGVLRRYNTTTLKVWQYFVGNVLSNAILGIMATALMFTFAITVFGLSMRGNYLNLLLVVVLGAILLFGIGLAIGGWAKNENQAAPIAQIIVLPMMFLSGVFFPTFLMPQFLQNITKFIPLTPVVDSIRLIITENAGLASLGPQLAIMLGWLVVVYALAFKIFRWE